MDKPKKRFNPNLVKQGKKMELFGHSGKEFLRSKVEAFNLKNAPSALDMVVVALCCEAVLRPVVLICCTKWVE